MILLSVKSTKTLTSTAFYIKNIQQGSCDITTDKDWLLVQLAIHIIGNKLRKLLIITWQKILLVLFRIEINFQFTKAAQQLSQDSFLLEKQQNFRWFHGFALHYESVELTEN